MIARFKMISCKHEDEQGEKCGVQCKSGKRGLCDRHYADYINSRSKQNVKEPTGKKPLHKMSKDKYSISNLQVLYQKFARIAGGEYCASCGIGSSDCGGHLIAKAKSKHVAILVTNIYPQCNNCNSPQGLDGNPKGLMKAGMRFWGKTAMQELLDLSRTDYTFNEGERKELYDKVVEALSILEDTASQFEKDRLRVGLFQWQREQSWYIN